MIKLRQIVSWTISRPIFVQSLYMDAFILHQKDLAFLHICYWSLIGENLLNTYYINNCLYLRLSCMDFSIWTSPYFSVFLWMCYICIYGPFILNQKDLAFLHTYVLLKLEKILTFYVNYFTNIISIYCQEYLNWLT